ncbi:MAG: hypothetical protein IK135_06335 [Bacteroidales bacterium]|nr:hypothetical protein [Bacteroidales bacterium]
MKKTLRRLAPVALVLVALATLSFMAKDGVTLRLKPQQGKTYTVTTKANMMTMMEVQGQSMNMSQSVETRQIFSAKEVTDAQSILETQIEAMKMTISQMGMKLEYDSEHPEKASPMLAGQTKDIEAKLHKPTDITYDVMGKLVGDSIDASMNQLGVIIELPENEVVVGSSWTNTTSQETGGMEFSADITYTVKAISKKSIDLTYTGKVNGSMADINGTYEGTATIDPQTGIITHNTQKQNISMTINEQGMSIPMTVIGNTTVEVK